MMIEVKELTKKFGDKIVFDKTSFSLPEKGLFILDSDNGSGKTTLLKLLIGEIEKDRGSIYLNGNEIDNISYYSTYLDQKNNFVSFLNLENNYFLESLIYKVNINEAGEKNRSFFIRKKPSKLSEGEKILFLLERALNETKPILLLDEITSHLDDENTNNIYEKIVELSKEKLVLLATHDYRIMKYPNNKILIKDKKIDVLYSECKEKTDTLILEKNDLKKIKKTANLHLFFKYLSARPILSVLLLCATIFLNMTFVNYIYVFSFDPSICLNSTNIFIDNFKVVSNEMNYKYNGKEINFVSSDSLNKSDVNTISSIFPNATFGWGILSFDNSGENYLKISNKTYDNLRLKGSYFDLYLNDNKINFIKDGFSFSLDYKVEGQEEARVDYNYFLSTLCEKRIGTNSIIFEDEFDNLDDVVDVFKQEKIYFTSYDSYLKEGNLDIEIGDNEIIVGEKYLQHDKKTLKPFDINKFDLYGDENNYFDLTMAFPNGIKVNYEPEISSRIGSREVIVSNNTFDKLIDSINFRRTCVRLGKSDSKKVNSYIVFGNGNTELNPVTFAFLPKNNRTVVANPTNSVSNYYEFLNKDLYMDFYGAMIYLACFVLYILLFLLFFAYSKRVYEKDFDILVRNGLNKNKKLLFELIKCFILFLISIIPGITVILFNPNLVFNYGLDGINPFSFNIISFLWYLVVFLILALIVLFINFKKSNLIVKLKKRFLYHINSTHIENK